MARDPDDDFDLDGVLDDIHNADRDPDDEPIEPKQKE